MNAPCSDSAPLHMAWGAPKAKSRLASAVTRQNLESKLKGKDWQSSDWPGVGGSGGLGDPCPAYCFN